jgi:hypothetical protein
MKAMRPNKRDMTLLRQMRDERLIAENIMLARHGLPRPGTMRTRHIRELDLLDKVIAYLDSSHRQGESQQP